MPCVVRSNNSAMPRERVSPAGTLRCLSDTVPHNVLCMWRLELQSVKAAARYSLPHKAAAAALLPRGSSRALCCGDGGCGRVCCCGSTCGCCCCSGGSGGGVGGLGAAHLLHKGADVVSKLVLVQLVVGARNLGEGCVDLCRRDFLQSSKQGRTQRQEKETERKRDRGVGVGLYVESAPAECA